MGVGYVLGRPHRVLLSYTLTDIHIKDNMYLLYHFIDGETEVHVSYLIYNPIIFLQ